MKKHSFYLFVLVLAISSCVSQKKYEDLQIRETRASKALQNTKKENDKLTEELTKLQSSNQKAMNDVRVMSDSIILLKGELDIMYGKLRDLEAEYNHLNNSMKGQLKGKNLDIENLRQELLATKKNLEEREQQLGEKEITFARLQSEFNSKEKRISELQNILESKDKEVKLLLEKIQKALVGFTDKGLSVNIRNGKVYVSMDEKLLFASGKWVVNSEGEKALKEVAKVLELNPDINVLVEGHTDNVPFKGNGEVKDNWDLSVLRSTAVVKVILKSAKITPTRITAGGRGEYAPIISNSTPANKAKNRRTEIILTPKLDEIFSILDK